MSDKKKKAAAITGVLLYLRARQAAMPAEEVKIPTGDMLSETTPVTSTSIWGLSGRQAQMQLRSLVQLRTFRIIGR
ncbi:MAG: hypothetical protein GXP53_05290 [Deltaproteobacteria bacterium]|nr:hypothetical protein [Deltaproteobacteria bacterium]